MKLGLIADIHGDSVALHKALALLQAQGVDQVICAGDLVDKGQDAEGVVEIIQSQNIPCVLGNHDADACADGFIFMERNERYGIEYSSEQDLSPALHAYLSTLPTSLKFEWAGKSIHLTHACTWDQITYLFPTAEASLFERIVREAAADVVILGHTHLPMIATVKGCLLINPGCVFYGYPEFRSTCAILSLPECTVTCFDVNTGAEIEPERVTL